MSSLLSRGSNHYASPDDYSYFFKWCLRSLLNLWYGSWSLGGFSPALSCPTNRCNFPCLMKASICCFRSYQLEVSCPWLRWKRQYLFLGLLFRSPFSSPSHAKAELSLICIRTWSSGALRGVKLAIRPGGGLDLRSSLLSHVLATFLPHSGWESSCFSRFFGLPPLAITTSLAFIFFVAWYNMSSMVFESFL